VKHHVLTVRVGDDLYLETTLSAKSRGEKHSEYLRNALIWFNQLNAGDHHQSIAQSREAEITKLKKMELRHQEELTQQQRKIAILDRLEEQTKLSAPPISRRSLDQHWKELHSKVKLLNQILQLENFYVYSQDERFHPRLDRFKHPLEEMGLTIPECLEVIQEIPDLVKNRLLTITPENGGATYKVSMVDTRGSGR